MTNPTQTKTYNDPAVSEATKRARAAEEAAKKAKQALRDAEEAAAKAKAEAEARSKVRAEQYMSMLQAEYPERVKAANARLVKARTHFQDVIAGEAKDTGVFAAYRDVLTARAEVWGVETELSETRARMGGAWREPRPVMIDFANDVQEILQHLAYIAQDKQQEAIRERLRRFMAGEDARAKEAA